MRKALSLFVLMWVARGFGSIDEMVVFMNTLRPGISSDAKVLVVDQKLHMFTAPYYLIYRAEAP